MSERELRVEIRREANMGRWLAWLTSAVAMVFAAADMFIGVAFFLDDAARESPTFVKAFGWAPPGTWSWVLVLSGFATAVGLTARRLLPLAAVGLCVAAAWFAAWAILRVLGGLSIYVLGVYAMIVFMHGLLAVIIPQVRKVEEKAR